MSGVWGKEAAEMKTKQVGCKGRMVSRESEREDLRLVGVAEGGGVRE